LFGVNRDNWVQDIEIIRELMSLLAPLFPGGNHFKFNKSTDGKQDIIAEDKVLRGVIEWLMTTNNKALISRQTHDDFIKDTWTTNKNDPEEHERLAELTNNFLAKAICELGFHCNTDGTLRIDRKPLTDPLGIQVSKLFDDILKKIIREMGVEQQCYPLAKHFFNRH
jgi:hypothetical protein